MSAQVKRAVINTPIIDATNKKSVDKLFVINLLKKYGVDQSAVDAHEIQLCDIISTLVKLRITIPENFFKELAFELGLKFTKKEEAIKILRNEKKSRLAEIVPFQIVSRYQIIPLQACKSKAVIAVSNPLDKQCLPMLQFLFGAWGSKIQVVSPKTIGWATEYLYSNIQKRKATQGLYNKSPDQSANKVLFSSQKYMLISVFFGLMLFSLINSAYVFTILFSTIALAYFTINPMKIYISLRGFQGPRSLTRITKGEMQWVLDEDLPVYTILVPLFKEAKVLSQIMRNLYWLNYPKDKLDVKILIEENDEETIVEAKKLGLFGSPAKRVEGIPEHQYSLFLKIFDTVIIPPGKIRTKPRACNYGLMRALGELCVIYDAEDKPDSDQLRKAAIVFLRQTEDVSCLQCKLNFYNADENILTKLFSIEYAYWYEFYLSGLDRFEVPIPLGGTSNHFRISKLNELGRWDPHNVTEDADVGIRLARNNFKTQMIDSTTYEEATLTPRSWIRQRSRWYKGYLQTYLVHMRFPKKLLKDLGLKKFIKFQLTFGGSIFIPIINPILWIITAISLLTPSFFGVLVPSFIQSICIFNLIFGNITYLLMYMISSIKLKKYNYIPYAMIMPIYWCLVSIASWRGLIQLIRNPFYWDKTTHGLSKILK